MKAKYVKHFEQSLLTHGILMFTLFIFKILMKKKNDKIFLVGII
jgi:hypothetical protein